MGKIALFILCLLFFSACSEQHQEQVPDIEVPQNFLASRQQQQAGKLLFKKHCRACHGSLAEGRNKGAGRFVPPAPDFFSDKYLSLDPARLYWRIAEGKRIASYRQQGSVMPAWEPYLTPQQIWQLVAYLRQRSGGE